MAADANPHGRVDDDGTVLVHDRATWRPVESFPDGTPDEALAYFERKFHELEAKVTLAEQRLAAKAPAKDLAAQIDKLIQDLAEPAAVGDLGALRQRAQTLQEALPTLVDAQKQESEAALQEALVTREAIVKALEELAAEDVQKIRWKAAGQTMAELFDQWQKHHVQLKRRKAERDADNSEFVGRGDPDAWQVLGHVIGAGLLRCADPRFGLKPQEPDHQCAADMRHCREGEDRMG